MAEHKIVCKHYLDVIPKTLAEGNLLELILNATEDTSTSKKTKNA